MTVEDLEVILMRMKRLDAETGDYEGDYEDSHGRADDLLAETIHALSEKQANETRELSLEILKAYDNVGKWYA